MMQDKPYLSLDERDRRYKLVREAMKDRGLDARTVEREGRVVRDEAPLVVAERVEEADVPIRGASEAELEGEAALA